MKKLKELKYKVVSWLGGNSRLYSEMLEEEITRRDVVLFNIAFTVLIFGILVVSQHTTVGLIAICSAGLLVNRLQRKKDNSM